MVRMGLESAIRDDDPDIIVLVEDPFRFLTDLLACAEEPWLLAVGLVDHDVAFVVMPVLAVEVAVD